jgi:hypothetical protein
MIGLVASAWLFCPDPAIRTGAPKSYTTRHKNETQFGHRVQWEQGGVEEGALADLLLVDGAAEIFATTWRRLTADAHRHTQPSEFGSIGQTNAGEQR